MHENAVYSSTIRQVTSRRILAFSLLWGFSFTPVNRSCCLPGKFGISAFTRRVLHFDPLTGRKRVTTLESASLGNWRGRQFERLLKILLFLAYFPPKLFVVLFRFPVEVRSDVLFPKAEVLVCDCFLEYHDQILFTVTDATG